jgi:hypothetical protein
VPGNDEEISGKGENRCPHGTGNIGAKRLGKRSERETVTFILCENSDGTEGAQKPVECGRAGVSEVCEFFGVFRAVGKMIGEAQLCCRAQQKTVKPIAICMS